LKYLPDEKDWVHMDKPWLCNVLYTLDPDGIQNMITEAMEIRKEKIEENRNLSVSMRPEFVEALNSCINFSSKLNFGLTVTSS